MASLRSRVIPAILVAAIVLVAASLVVGTLRRPEPPAFAPTSPRPLEVPDSLVGPLLYTVDATDPEEWRFFDFSRGSVVEDPAPEAWDLAFRRNEIVVNGGEMPGRGGVIALEGAAFDSVRVVPAEGYLDTRVGRDTLGPGIGKWYDYGFTSHLLTPRPVVYAVRTADGRYAKLEIVSYYCPGARAGCLTFRYAYRSDGSRVVSRER